MKISQWIRLGACVALASSLLGCATPLDTTPLFNAHVATLEQSAPSVKHLIGRADGYQIAVREFGIQAHKTGPTILLMHGFPDNQHLYDAVVPALASQYHVLTFDFLGWGASDKPVGHVYNVASQRADLDAVVAHFGLTSVVVVVHDLSGQVGIDWALDNEAKTSGLVLLNTYYNTMPELTAPPAIATFSTPGFSRDVSIWASGKSPSRFKAGVASQLGKFFSNPASRDIYVPVLTHRAQEIFPAFVSSTSGLWAEIAARDAQVPRMMVFSKPVSVIFGADDRYLNASVARSFTRTFPKSTLHLLANAGHYVQLDAPKQVSDGIASNIAESSGLPRN
jgi:haloalkane dehalogenase